MHYFPNQNSNIVSVNVKQHDFWQDFTMWGEKYLNCPSSYICVRRSKMPLHLNFFLLDGRKSHANTFDERYTIFDFVILRFSQSKQF